MFRPRRGYGGQSRAPGIALMFLALQMFQVGFDRIPPTTLCTIAGQVVIYLKLFNIRWPSIGEVCISPINVWYKEDWTRLLTAAFFHANEWHLYYNMVSFLWKGLTLERRLGSGYFAFLIALFAVLCNTTTIALGMLAENYFHDPSYLSQCAVGFSGVIFALKVITTYMLPPGVQYVMGLIPVPSRYAVWAELGVIQLLVPNASFLGHLAGILVGLAYVKGPLKAVLDMVVPSAPTYTYQARPSGYRSRFWGGGTPAAQPTAHPGYDRYTGGMSEEEQMAQAVRDSRQQNGLEDDEQLARAIHESMRDSTSQNSQSETRRRPEPSAPPEQWEPPLAQNARPQSTNRLYPDLPSQTVDQEDLRRRRLARFQ